MTQITLFQFSRCNIAHRFKLVIFHAASIQRLFRLHHFYFGNAVAWIMFYSWAHFIQIYVFAPTVSVVVLFFVSWAPFHFQRLGYVYFREHEYFRTVNQYLFYLSGCFYFLSSTLNPVLYNLMSAKYREAFKRALLCQPPNSPSRPTENTCATTNLLNRYLKDQFWCLKEQYMFFVAAATWGCSWKVSWTAGEQAEPAQTEGAKTFVCPHFNGHPCPGMRSGEGAAPWSLHPVSLSATATHPDVVSAGRNLPGKDFFF